MRHFVRSVVALACRCGVRRPARRPQTDDLKMQATWPASLTLYENFTYFVDRVSKISGGHTQDRRDAGGTGGAGVRGARRHAQEGARRRARLVGLLGRQEQGRDPVHRRPRRHLRHGHDRRHRLDAPRRRNRAVQRVLPEGAQAQRAVDPDPALGPAGLRLVQAADQEPRGLQGHEVPADRDGGRGLAAGWACRRSTCRAARSSPPRSAA